MIDKLKELMKKKGEKASPEEVGPKQAAVDHMRQIAEEMMKNGVTDGLKKVTVASDSKEGLSKGLDLAKEKMGQLPEEPLKEEQQEEASESPEEESSELAGLDKDALEKLKMHIEELLLKKA